MFLLVTPINAAGEKCRDIGLNFDLVLMFQRVKETGSDQVEREVTKLTLTNREILMIADLPKDLLKRMSEQRKNK